MSGTGPSTPFTRFPDANRSARVDVRVATVGTLQQELRGPWIQGAMPDDWTLYLTRVVQREPPPSTRRERGVTVRVEMGSGVALVSTTLVSRLPLRGIAVHVAAEAVRSLLVVDVDVSGDILRDEVFAWLAPGRPMLALVPDDIDLFPSEVPQFARRLRVQGNADGLPPSAAPTDVGIEWRDLAGSLLVTSYVDPTLYYREQSFEIPWRAATATLVNGGGDPLPMQGTWEVYS